MNMPGKASIAKGATVGAAAYALSSTVFGQGGRSFNVYGRTVSIPMFSALATGVGSVAADLSHATLFHYLPLSQKYDQLKATATSAAVSTGIFYGTAMAIDARLPGEFGLLSMAGTTLLANAIGDYAYATVLAPMLE